MASDPNQDPEASRASATQDPPPDDPPDGTSDDGGDASDSSELGEQSLYVSTQQMSVEVCSLKVNVHYTITVCDKPQPTTTPPPTTTPDTTSTPTPGVTETPETTDTPAPTGTPETTVTPPPPPIWVVTLSLEDPHFNFDSAFLLPDKRTDAAAQGGQIENAGLKDIADALRAAHQLRDYRLFVAGHTDSSGSHEYNELLSEYRARTVLSALTGDRETFVTTVVAQWKRAKPITSVEDYQYALTWAADFTKRSELSPNGIDGDYGPGTRGAIKELIGQAAAADPKDEAMARKIAGAFWDLYDQFLGGGDGVGGDLSTFRSEANDPTPKHAGYAYDQALEQPGVHGVKSEKNRRVDLLFFPPDPNGGPQMPAANQIYTSEHKGRVAKGHWKGVKLWKVGIPNVAELPVWQSDETE